jgi:eukaryotic-like serine/threonine-protein kinase
MDTATPADKVGPAGTIVVSPPLSEQPGDRIGRYKLLEQIGEGGFGVVYVAEQEEPVRRRVALKVIKLGMDTKEVIARFEAERQALALMDHPHIAKVLDAGATAGGRPYFVMELVKGERITDYCDKNNLTTRQRLDLFVQICQAIQHAHQKGIIHRDIKPSNILVTMQDGAPAPKVIDFGIAKATEHRLTDKTIYTALEQIIGTPAYMSPEQAEMTGLDIDTRSDIYSLGVLLYELLTGKTPFDPKELMARGIEEMRRAIREQEPRRPSTRLTTMDKGELTTTARRRQTDAPKLVHLVRGDLDWIAMKCLEKDRTRRYETAYGLAMEIERHLNNEPVLARPPRAMYRLQKAVRRNKLLFSAGTVVAVTLVLATVVSLDLLVKERAALATAKAKTTEALEQKSIAEKQRNSADEQKAKAQAQQKIAEQRSRELKIQIDRTAVALSALSEQDFNQAQARAAEDDNRGAVAYLIRSLEADPQNRLAARRLAFLLAHNIWPSLFLPTGNHKRTKAAAEYDLAHALFSPDGNRVMTISDNAAQIWDAHNGRFIAQPADQKAYIYSAEFNPDGKSILTASTDRIERIWDAETGQPKTKPLQREANITHAVFSPDGNKVLTGLLDGTALVWDPLTGDSLIKPLKHTNAITAAAFSPDGNRIITASGKEVWLWDAKSGEALGPPLKFPNLGDFELPTSVRFMDGGRKIVAHAFRMDGPQWIWWDAQTGHTIDQPWDSEFADRRRGSLARQLPQGLTGVNYEDFTLDEKRVVVAGNAFGANPEVWDVENSKKLAELNHDVDQYWFVRKISFSQDGRKILTASTANPTHNMNVQVWAAQTGLPISASISAEDRVGSSIEFSPDGRRILSTASAGAQIWDLPALPPLATPLRGANNILSAKFHPGGTQVVTTSREKKAQIWDAQTGSLLPAPVGQESNIDSIPFSPDGKLFATVSGHVLQLWNAQTGQKIGKEMQNKTNVSLALFTQDARRILALSGNLAQLWDTETCQKFGPPLQHQGNVRFAQFSPDEKQILSVSGQVVQLWDAQTGQPIGGPLRHDADVSFAIFFGSDGKQILTLQLNYSARLWNAETGQPIAAPADLGSALFGATPNAHGSRILTVAGTEASLWEGATRQRLAQLAVPLQHRNKYVSDYGFSHDETLLYLVRGRNLSVYDASKGDLVASWENARDIRAARSSPDGSRMVVVSEDGTSCIWDIAPVGPQLPEWILSLAEVTAGARVSDSGDAEPTKLQRAEIQPAIRKNLHESAASDDWTIWGRWFLADAATRTVSPFSKMTLPDYIQARIQEKTAGSLDEAQSLALEDGKMIARIEQTRDEAQKNFAYWKQAVEALTQSASLALQNPYEQDHVHDLIKSLYSKASAALQTATNDPSQLMALYRARAEFFAQHGRWTNAAADALAIVQHGTTDHNDYHTAIPLLAASGDRDEYVRVCQSALKQFKATSDPPTADRIAKDCLILPLSGIDLQSVDELADTAVTLGARHAYVAYFQCTRALAAYRVGHDASALDWVGKTLSRSQSVELLAEAHAVSSMAHQRLGHVEDAKAALAKAVQEQRKLPELSSGQIGEEWRDWIIAGALVDEATKLVNGQPAASK